MDKVLGLIISAILIAAGEITAAKIPDIWTCLPEPLPAVRKKDFDADSLCAGIATFSGTVSSVPSAGIIGL